MQYTTSIVFLWALHKHGQTSKGIQLAWMGLPALRDLVPFVDVGWKLLTRTLFKMAAFASISSIATTLPKKSVAAHQVSVPHSVRRSWWRLSCPEQRGRMVTGVPLAVLVLFALQARAQKQ
jgi:hypothetical protein